jgi:NADH dehydrogenase (ubiquinone) Fe-S protein 6
MMPVARMYLARSRVRMVRSNARPLSTTSQFRNQGPRTGENRHQANDPLPPKQTPNVSLTDEVKTDAMGARDAPLQEMEPEAEKKREMQAPNRSGIWSRNQQPRELAMTGPRFEQTIMETQVRRHPCRE